MSGGRCAAGAARVEECGGGGRGEPDRLMSRQDCATMGGAAISIAAPLGAAVASAEAAAVPRVVVVQRRLVEYRVPLFERMREALAACGVALEVVHGRPRPSERSRGDAGALSWAREVPARYLPGREGPAVWMRPGAGGAAVGGAALVVVPGETGFLPLYALLARRLAGGPRLALWGHGANFQAPGGESGARRRLRRWVNRRPDWWFAYTALSVERVAADGFPRERITRLDNAVDTAALARWREATTPGEIGETRRALGLGEGPVGVFVGGLHRHRLLPVLFAAADRLRARVPGFGLLVIGDGPLAGEVREFAAVRPWVRWTGALRGREMVRHALVGSVALIPGMVGLNVLDAFALGLPLVTTECGLHSPEIAYLEAGRNGVSTALDVVEYAEAAARLLEDREGLAAMAARCREDAARYTVEAMAGRFVAGILAAMGRGE